MPATKNITVLLEQRGTDHHYLYKEAIKLQTVFNQNHSIHCVIHTWKGYDPAQ
jgi:hypothetical protein